MKRYNRGVRLARKPKSELQAELIQAQRELDRLEDSNSPWSMKARRNAGSRIGRIRAALRIADDRDFEEMTENK